MESNKIRFYILWFFCDLLWFFKDSAEINKKEKDKTAFKTAYNRAREVRWTVLKVKRCVLPCFGVQGGNMNSFLFAIARVYLDGLKITSQLVKVG